MIINMNCREAIHAANAIYKAADEAYRNMLLHKERGNQNLYNGTSSEWTMLLDLADRIHRTYQDEMKRR